MTSTTKYLSLNPSIPSQNGVTITLLKDTTTNSRSQWFISSTDNAGFHMKLSLNNTWSFHPIFPTSLTLQIDINSPIITNNTDLLLLFSQSNRYFSTMIQLDGTNDHLIYPQCKIHPNISLLIQSNNLTAYNRIQSALNNTLNSYLLPNTNISNISYPLTFTLKNDPSQNTLLFSYSNPTSNIRTCTYNSMSNTSIDIYIAAAYNSTQLNITSINITHFINDTTIAPSHTSNPTIEPTLEPTYYPTIEPTFLPTINPSIAPIKMTADGPWNNVTKTTGISDESRSTMYLITTYVRTNNNDDLIGQINIIGLDDNIFVLLIICIGVVFCLCICLIIIICIKKQKHKHNKGMITTTVTSSSQIPLNENDVTDGHGHDNNIETVELIECNDYQQEPEQDTNNDTKAEVSSVKNGKHKVKVTVTAFADDINDEQSSESSDSSDLINNQQEQVPPVVPPVPKDDSDLKDNNSDSDNSLYQLQHEYLHSEINEMEDQQERTLLSVENEGIDKITDDGNDGIVGIGVTDNGKGITDDGMNVFDKVTDDGINNGDKDSESDDNELLNGMNTTTGGNDHDDDDENVPPPPVPPVPNDNK